MSNYYGTEYLKPRIIRLPAGTPTGEEEVLFCSSGMGASRWHVRVVTHGERYGANDCLRHGRDEPLVEFYDATQDPQKFGPRGQFVARYNLGTLVLHPPNSGLNLLDYEPSWRVDASVVRDAVAFAIRRVW